jgi:hypothetical protein
MKIMTPLRLVPKCLVSHVSFLDDFSAPSTADFIATIVGMQNHESYVK